MYREYIFDRMFPLEAFWIKNGKNYKYENRKKANGVILNSKNEKEYPKVNEW